MDQHSEQEVAVHRVSEIIGKPTVSAETGDRLGKVADALLADGGINVVAIVLGGGLLGKERVLPFHDIQTLGGDTVLARTESGIREPLEWRRAGVKATRSSALRGKPVVTVGGQRVGEVSDLLVNDETGKFAGVEVETRHLGGFRTKRAILRASDDMRIGPDAVIVGDGALDQVDGPEHRHVARSARRQQGT